MTDLFLKSNKKSVENNTTTDINISEILSIKSKNNLKNNFSATSAINNSYYGGNNKNSVTSYVSATSDNNLSKINSKDINNLISMLTSESNNNTNTEKLENKLVDLLNKQNGGNIDDNISTEVLENKIKNIIAESNKSQNYNIKGGSSVDKSFLTFAGLGLAAAAYSNYLGPNDNTKSETLSSILVEDKSKNVTNTNTLGIIEEELTPISSTSTEFVDIDNREKKLEQEQLLKKLEEEEKQRLKKEEEQLEEEKKRLQEEEEQLKEKEQQVINEEEQLKEKEQQVINEEKQLEEEKKEQSGGELSQGMLVFGKISKMVSDKLGIPNGRNCKTIAGQLQRDVKSKDPSISVDKLLSAAKELLEKNMSKYKNMAK